MKETITDLIETAMQRTRKTAVDVERQTGVPASWTRQLKAGRVGGRADPKRIRKVSEALSLDESQVWALLGRMDLVAVLRGDDAMPTPDDGTTPAGVGAYLERIDALVGLVEKLLTRIPMPADPLSQGPTLTQSESLLLDSSHARLERERTQPGRAPGRSADIGRSPGGHTAS